MDKHKEWPSLISQARRAANAAEQLSALRHCAALPMHHHQVLTEYHDVLLFTCAYAYSGEVYLLAKQELQRISGILKGHLVSRRWQEKLTGSGLPYTTIHCQYSADLLDWLLETFPGKVVPFMAESSNEMILQLCQAALPGVEFHDTTQGGLNTWNRIRSLSGHYRNAAALKWLLQLFNQQTWSPVLKDHLFDSLRIFIRWNILNDQYSRSWLRIPVQTYHYRGNEKKQVNSLSVIRKSVGQPLAINAAEKSDLVSAARVILALYYRETDPVTYADPDETYLYDMGNGLQILLTGMKKERRLSIESYVGFMAFINGIPASYGGGWMFGSRCKIGINIFPPFRGGASAQLFCQVMRLYFQVYHARCFVVKPYQFGKGNPEGLKSGAFWFYYKLGFRPVNPAIKKAADAEWKKITADKKYRTPVNVLKSFTACNKEWEPLRTPILFFDADKVSMAITHMIRKRFAGNREKAIIVCMQELVAFTAVKKSGHLSPHELKIWQNWSLLFAILPGTAAWNKLQRKLWLELLELKANGKEKDFVLALQQHSAFWESLKILIPG